MLSAAWRDGISRLSVRVLTDSAGRRLGVERSADEHAAKANAPATIRRMMLELMTT
jgi:hypothetical protein